LKDDRLYFEHMREHCGRIARFIAPADHRRDELAGWLA
jgi:hypothetical protein